MAKKERKKHVGLRIVLWLLAAVLLIFGIFAIVLRVKFGDFYKSCKSDANAALRGVTEETFQPVKTTIIYASDGSILSSLSLSKDVYYLSYEQLPEDSIYAMLAVEDRNFYDHPGYDLKAIIRAARSYIEKNGEITQGGSTITQQLARKMFLTDEVTFKRKLTEIMIAAGLEKRFSKKQILEFYMNNIYFANGYYGIQAAAQGYFSKAASQLTLSETAYLCGITNSPAALDPLKNPEKTLERRDSVLAQMVEFGAISDEEFREARNEEIVLHRSEPNEKQDYLETFAKYCAIRDIMEARGLEFDYDTYYAVEHELYRKGYRVYTSLDRSRQALLQSSLDDGLAIFEEVNEEGVYKVQGSGVCIDNETGRVTAIVGGRSQGLPGYTLNRAYQSPRQPGSAIKPLIVYGPAFERGYTLETTVVDEKFEGGPRNSDRTYAGEIDVKTAIYLSKNTVAWKIFEELTPEVGLSYLKKMRFASISELDYYPAASLGGMSKGATALEMASAYAAIANLGVWRVPTCVVKITDDLGETVVDTSQFDSTAVYTREAAEMLDDALAAVMIHGTGRNLALEGKRSCGKTGTTNTRKDGWFCGYTKDFTAAVWVGADLPREIEGLAGNSYPGRIWQNFMQNVK